MKKTLLAALIAGSQLLLIKPATAITFNFSWTSEAEGLSIVGGSSVVHRATGTIDIDVMRGQDFTASDVTSLDITVTDGTNSVELSGENTTLDMAGTLTKNRVSITVLT